MRRANLRRAYFFAGRRAGRRSRASVGGVKRNESDTAAIIIALIFGVGVFGLFFVYPLLAIGISVGLFILGAAVDNPVRRKISGYSFFADHNRAQRKNGGDAAAIKGDAGEDEVRAALNRLDENYVSFHDLILPLARGNSQIDHIVVSEFGVFVIETKNYSGWIFGKPNEKNWTKRIYNRATRRPDSYSFQNPLHQNYGHIKAVEEFCGIAPEQVISVIVFTENCEFKTPMPDNVIYVRDLRSFITARQTPLLSAEKLKAVIHRLYAEAEGSAAAA